MAGGILLSYILSPTTERQLHLRSALEIPASGKNNIRNKDICSIHITLALATPASCPGKEKKNRNSLQD